LTFIKLLYKISLLKRKLPFQKLGENEHEKVCRVGLINQMAAQDKSAIMIFSELPELLGMCDRICVINEGRRGLCDSQHREKSAGPG